MTSALCEIAYYGQRLNTRKGLGTILQVTDGGSDGLGGILYDVYILLDKDKYLLERALSTYALEQMLF